MAIIGQESGSYTPADVERKRRFAKMLMEGQQQAREPFGALAQGLRGALSGWNEYEAGKAESEGTSALAELLKAGDYQGVLSNEWAASNPQLLAQAAMLQGRDWELGDRAAQWAREDSRFSQQQALEREKMNQPEWGFENINGDIVAFNKRDPSAGTQTVFDGPDPVPDPFTLGEGDVRFSGTGAEIARGVPKTPDTLINNNLGGTDDFYKKLDTDAGAQQAALIDAGRNAASNNMRMEQVKTLLQTAPQGAAGAFTQFAGSLGIPVEGLDEVQAAQALINQMVPGQRPPGSGTMSDADLALFKQSLPAIINQPQGNQKIIDTTLAINDYTMKQAAIAEQVANREISPAEGRALQSKIPNPLAGFSATETNGWTDLGNGIKIREK